MGERSAVMSWAMNCPKKGQPAAAVPSSPVASLPSHSPPEDPSASSAAWSDASAGRSGNARP